MNSPKLKRKVLLASTSRLCFSSPHRMCNAFLSLIPLPHFHLFAFAPPLPSPSQSSAGCPPPVPTADGQAMSCFCPWLLLLLCSLVPLYYCLRYLWELFPLPKWSSKAVFISGCDSGFGRLLALKLAASGILVFAGCLTEKGQKELEAEAKSQGIAERIVTLPLDVTSDRSVKEAAEFVAAKLPESRVLWALVNNAGTLSCYGPDAWTPIEEYMNAMDVNCWGCIRCTHAFLPMLKRSRGRIVSVSSVAGRVSVPCGAPYALAKYGIEAYMDAIRLELAVFGITCCILEPGMYRTKLISEENMWQRVNMVWARLDSKMREEYGEKFKDHFVKSWNTLFQERASDQLSDVVNAYFHAITARFPRLRYRIGWDSILLYIPYSFLPTGIGDALFRAITRAKTKVPILPAVIERQRNGAKKAKAL